MELRLPLELIQDLLEIQNQETDRGVDLCHEKLQILWEYDCDLPVVRDYNGFSEPGYPYGIYLYGELGKSMELEIVRDCEVFTYTVAVEEG